ncbi:hypothetical protein AGR56_17495 [Clostridium sp. DMHC 10]|uniref:hypothetical protein n=1 Tax=Clostridium sp. DMHC 10 TaxID=747377 RepID=UPI00069D7F6D|nr:hypothetical protein [Clostridium sp. DMHC 10]KOF55652.1 hypothetical protein AGR56_17495 [Clostridium sp. DMHC 10]
MNNKDAILKIVVGVFVVLIIRYVGVEHIPPLGIFIIFLFVMTYFIFKISISKKGQNKDIYFHVFAYLLIAFLTNGMIMYLIQYKYPQYLTITKPIIIPIFIILFILLTIFVFIWAIMSNKK